MSRFVLLFHDWPAGPRGLHCDLMLQRGDVLLTWSLAELPRDWATFGNLKISASNCVAAERLGDHRLAYLDYEGPVSGERGNVRQLDRGECVIREVTADNVVAKLRGDVACGIVELRHVGESWTLTVR